MRRLIQIGTFIAWVATVAGGVFAALSYAESSAEKRVDKAYGEILVKLAPEERKSVEDLLRATRDLSKSAIGGGDNQAEIQKSVSEIQASVKKLAPLPALKGVGRFELLPEKPVHLCDGTDILTYKEGREGVVVVSVNSGQQYLQIGQKMRFSLQKRGTVILTLISKGKGTIDLMVECETG